MKSFAILGATALVLLFTSARAEQADAWKVICQPLDGAVEPRCHVAFFDEGEGSRPWVGLAVELQDGRPEVQVTAKGEAFRSAEIDVIADTTVVTDFCYDSYCVFINAQDLVDHFRAKRRADVRIYNGAEGATVTQSVSLMGFSKAYDEYLRVVGD